MYNFSEKLKNSFLDYHSKREEIIKINNNIADILFPTFNELLQNKEFDKAKNIINSMLNVPLKLKWYLSYLNIIDNFIFRYS